MQISIIGTGNVGSTLGRRWAEKGHRVIFGARDPNGEKVKALKESIPDVKIMNLKDAAAESGIMVLATPWKAVEETLRNAGNLNGKIVIDCTNPLAPDLSGLTIGHTSSAGEKVAEWARGAYVVKAFNTTGTKNMANPVYGQEKISMLICGDDLQAKKTVARLASDIDFDVIDAGPLTASRYLEPLAMLWIHLVYMTGMGQDIAFKLLKR